MISGLTVRNFKCFKDTTLPFRPITVISGGNGVGKSSTIQSLLILRQTADQLRVLDDLGALDAGGQAEFPVKLNGPYRLALGNTLTLTNSEIESPVIEIGVRSRDSADAASLNVKFLADTVSADVTLTCQHPALNSKRMLDRENSFPVFANQFHYLVAERNGPRDLSGVSDDRFLSTGLAGEYTADAIARAESQNLAVHEKLQISDGSNLFKVQLEGWMRLLVPGIKIATQSYPEINRVRLSIEKSGSPVGPMLPTSTGFGISYVLPVIVSGLLAQPGSMLIVENTEAHLHPAAQSAIGRFLACVSSSGVQVVVETHSENVINGVRLAVIDGLVSSDDVGLLFFSPREGDTEPNVDAISIDSLAELSLWPKGFFDQQSSDLAKLIAARRAQRSSSQAK